MKIFSWNVNGIRAVEKKGNLAEFLSVKNPDIACFQEIKIDETQISKENFELSDNFGDAATEGRICAAKFNNFWLITVYTPNTKNDLGRLKLRENWDVAFLAFSKGLENGEFSREDFTENLEIIEENPQDIFKPSSVIFCGDLNVAHEEIDLSNPKANRGKHGFTDFLIS